MVVGDNKVARSAFKHPYLFFISNMMDESRVVFVAVQETTATPLIWYVTESFIVTHVSPLPHDRVGS